MAFVATFAPSAAQDEVALRDLSMDALIARLPANAAEEWSGAQMRGSLDAACQEMRRRLRQGEAMTDAQWRAASAGGSHELLCGNCENTFRTRERSLGQLRPSRCCRARRCSHGASRAGRVSLQWGSAHASSSTDLHPRAHARARSSRAMPAPYGFTHRKRLGMGRGSAWRAQFSICRVGARADPWRGACPAR